MDAPSRRIIFTGPGGAGKTTLGGQVAASLGLPFFDLDAMFCDQILNIRSFIQVNGYAAYSRRNGMLLSTFLDTSPPYMVVSLSSGALSEDMAEPMRAELISKIRVSGDVFLILPDADDELAAKIVAERQVGRGFGLRYEPERRKYLRRVMEYRRLGFPEIVASSKTQDCLRLALERITACVGNDG
jgi:shikimate kinase